MTARVPRKRITSALALIREKRRTRATFSEARPRLTLVALAALAALATVLPGAASASSVSFSGDVLTYNAAPGETETQ